MKQILVYDISVLPRDAGVDVNKMLELYTEHQFIVWDSYGATEGQDCSPKVLNLPEGTKMTILDLKDRKSFDELKKALSESMDEELLKEMLNFKTPKDDKSQV